MRVKVLSKQQFVDLTHNGTGKRPHIADVLSLPEKNYYPIVSHMLHNDDSVRAIVGIDRLGASLEIDLPVEAFNELPFKEVEE